LVIVGEPGIGKSAIAAWLSVVRRDQTIAIHFCTDRNTRTLNPSEFVASLVGQLCTQVSGFNEIVALRQPEVRRPRANDAFRELVVEPSRKVTPPSRPLLAVVDSLDEAVAQEGETLLDVLVNQAEDLPSWLRIVTTSRPDERVLQKIRRLHTFELNADRAENISDLAEYIQARLARSSLADRFSAESSGLISTRLLQLAEGNFLYARMAMEAFEDGTLSVADLGALSQGLSDFYAKTFAKRFLNAETFARDSLPILRMLSVARGPVPFTFLDRVSRQPKETIEATNRRLLALRPYLRASGKGLVATYTLFHKSLGDWLTDPDAAGIFWCHRETGEVELADACWLDYEEDVEKMTAYALRYAMLHLHLAVREADAKKLSEDRVFRSRRLEMGLCSFYLCYARSDDEPFVAKLHRDLTALGFEVWWDRVSMPTRRLVFVQEVREAIAACDRFVLVVGPKAAASDYVTAEWRYAVEMGKPVALLLRHGDYNLIPDELKLLHCEDFREDTGYDLHIERLAFYYEKLTALTKRDLMGKLIGVPSLPPNYVYQLSRLRPLKDAVLTNLGRPVVISGTAARVGVLGLGGIGKTVLATALSRDQEIRRAFPDGVIWLTLGQNPNLVQLQRYVGHALDCQDSFDTVTQGQDVLRRFLHPRAVLLVLDDVRDRSDAEALDALGPRCRMVITARDADVVTNLRPRFLCMLGERTLLVVWEGVQRQIH